MRRSGRGVAREGQQFRDGEEAEGLGEEGRCSRGRGVQQSAVAAGGSGSDFEEEQQGREVRGATRQGEKKQQ